MKFLTQCEFQLHNQTGKKENILIMEQMEFKIMLQTIFLMTIWFYLRKMVEILAQMKSQLPIGCLESAGLIIMPMF